MAEIVNLRRARKQKSRAEREERAAANRLEHGRTRAEREALELERHLAGRRLDWHRLETVRQPVRYEHEEPCGEAFDRDRRS
jgi:hypothetical protein